MIYYSTFAWELNSIFVTWRQGKSLIFLSERANEREGASTAALTSSNNQNKSCCLASDSKFRNGMEKFWNKFDTKRNKFTNLMFTFEAAKPFFFDLLTFYFLLFAFSIYLRIILSENYNSKEQPGEWNLVSQAKCVRGNVRPWSCIVKGDITTAQ